MRRLLPRLLVLLAVLAVAFAVWVWAGLPSRAQVRELARKNPGKTRLMLQRESEARQKQRRPRSAQAWVPLTAVSRHLIHAVLSAEDQRFFGHEGVDWAAIQKSLEKDVEKRRFVRGGSTITQQLAKNLYFGTQKTITRKLREFIVARWLEEDLRKTRILALYLNVIEWGDGVYGVEAAARRWYGKSASALTPAEAAGLAAMIPNPRRINPQANLARHTRATRRVMWLMGQAGYIGRDVAGLGSEPPPEEVPEDEEDEPLSAAGDAPSEPAAAPEADPAPDAAAPQPVPDGEPGALAPPPATDPTGPVTGPTQPGTAPEEPATAPAEAATPPSAPDAKPTPEQP